MNERNNPEADLTPEARFEEIYRLTYRNTLAYVRRRTVETSDAFDVVSETYLVAWRRLDTLLETSEPQAWLYSIAYRTLLNLRRAQRRRKSLLARVTLNESGRQQSDPAESLDANDELALVEAAMEQLSPRDQELLRLVAYERLSHAQIAVALDIRPGLIRSALHRARGRLEDETKRLKRRQIQFAGHKHENGFHVEGDEEPSR